MLDENDTLVIRVDRDVKQAGSRHWVDVVRREPRRSAQADANRSDIAWEVRLSRRHHYSVSTLNSALSSTSCFSLWQIRYQCQCLCQQPLSMHRPKRKPLRSNRIRGYISTDKAGRGVWRMRTGTSWSTTHRRESGCQWCVTCRAECQAAKEGRPYDAVLGTGRRGTSQESAGRVFRRRRR